jgi:hypothetical protein
MPMRDAGSRPARKRAGACPACGSRAVVPIIHGIPSPAQWEALKKGDAVAADREEWEGLTEWYCKACGCDWSAAWRRFKKAPA